MENRTPAYMPDEITFAIGSDKYCIFSIAFKAIQTKGNQIFYNNGYGYILKKNGKAMMIEEITPTLTNTLLNYNFTPRI